MEEKFYCPRCGKKAGEICNPESANDVYTLHVDTFDKPVNEGPDLELVDSEYCNDLEAVVCSECGFEFFKSA